MPRSLRQFQPPSDSRVSTGIFTEVLPLLPAAAAVTFWVLSATFSGAYFTASWYPAAIVATVICPLLLAAGWRLPVGGTRTSLFLLIAFVAWTGLSIVWAEAGGHALEATNKLVLALATTFIFAVTPWTARRALIVFLLFTVGIWIVSMVTLLSAALASDPSGSFIQERFSAPLGYAGASGAFAGLAVWPATGMSTSGTLPSWSRALLVGVAVTQVELALLPQSRGALLGLIVGAVVFVFFSADRVWAVIRVGLMAAIVAVTVGPVLDVYTAATESRSVVGPLDDAVTAVIIAFVVATVVGLLLAWGQERWPRPAGLTVEGRQLRILSVAVLILGILVAIFFGGRIGHDASSRWDDFKGGNTVAARGESRLTSTEDPERYDYYRVATDSFSEKPLIGIGAGNFQDAYTIHRHQEKHSRYTHDIWLRILSETGAIGFLLFVFAIGGVYVSVGLSRRRIAPEALALTAGALGLTATVLAHSSVDWVEEFPPILGACLGFLFLAGRLSTPTPPGPPPRQALGLLGATVLAGIALAGLVPAYLSTRYTGRALDSWFDQPADAYADLDRAAYLDPLSSEPQLVRGEIAIARHEPLRAKQAFESAIEKENNWYPHFELALLASQAKEPESAVAQITVAHRLDPHDPLVEEVLAALRRGRRLDPLHVAEQIAAETNKQFSNELRGG